MYDIHCHLLPGVEDGPESIEESIEMIIAAAGAGIKGIIATPHYTEGMHHKTRQYNLELVSLLNKIISKRGMEIELYLGNEVLITPNILALLAGGEVSALGDSRYILIELPRIDIPIFLYELVYELRIKGMIPVIAHPERNMKIIENHDILNELIIRGCLSQVNISSIAGKYGGKVRNAALELLRHRMMHFIASDAHSRNDYTYYFCQGMRVLQRLKNGDKITEFARANSESVIMNKLPDIEQPIRSGKRIKNTL